MKKTVKMKRLVTIMLVIAMLFSLFTFASAQSEKTSTKQVPIKLVFNVNYNVDYINDELAHTKDGEFDLSKSVDAVLDMKKGYQTISFSISDIKAKLGEGAKIESIGIIPGGSPKFDQDSWSVIGGWPNDVNTLWVDDITAGNIPIFKDGEVREFIFKNFTAPMDADWNELYDSPRYAYYGYGINGIISDTEGVKNSSCIKYSINGGVGAAWMVYKEPVDISGLAETDKLQLSIDIGQNAYAKWTPDPVTAVPEAPAATYEIGPGKQYENIGDFAWETLKAGDVVYIYWKETPYNEKFSVIAEGTKEKPIIIHGVPGPNGELPRIDGNNATSRKGMTIGNQGRSLVVIGNGDSAAKYVTVENLEVYNAHPSKKFINPKDGKLKDYKNNATGIWVERGENITIHNCIVHDNGNGLFVSSYSDIDYWSGNSPFDSFINYASRDILVDSNYFYNNGTSKRMFEHNSYSAAINTTYQFNHYGPLLNGSKGYGLKDRGSGTVIRYNWIEGGRRQISLDDGEDTALIVFDPKYNDSYVYGNVLVEPDHKFDCYGDDEIVHFGGDSASIPDRHGILYFYNNTIATYRMVKEYGPDSFIQGWKERTVLFYLPSNDQRVDARNNIFYKGGDAPISIITDTGIVDMSHNWISEGWVKSLSDPETSISVVNADGTNITGTDPGFVNPDLGAPSVAEMKAENTVTLGVKLGSNKLAVDNEGIARDGRKQDIVMGTPVTAINGRACMSVQKLVEYLGGVYYWVGDDNRVDIVLGLNKISLWVGKAEAQVNGSTVKIDPSNPQITPTIADTGEVIAPVRFVAEAMGAVVTWNQDDKSIVIKRDVGRNYMLKKDSACIKAGVNIPSSILSNKNFNYQYVKHQSGEARSNNPFKDIGAYGFED